MSDSLSIVLLDLLDFSSELYIDLSFFELESVFGKFILLILNLLFLFLSNDCDSLSPILVGLVLLKLSILSRDGELKSHFGIMFTFRCLSDLHSRLSLVIL